MLEEKTNNNKKKTNKNMHYVDDKKFYEAMKEHIEKYREVRRKNETLEKQGKELLPDPKISDYIGECIFKIAENLSRRANFAGYPYKDDMIGDRNRKFHQLFKQLRSR